MQKTAVTIGFFDGVHTGHRHLVHQLKQLADERGLCPVVVSFRNHPLEVVRPGFRPMLLTSPAEKTDLLHQAGVQRVELLDFDERMMLMSAATFMREVLCRQFHASLLLLGYDNRIGHDANLELDDYGAEGETLGLEVVQASRLSDDTLSISSSSIRQALLQGDIMAANRLLGYAYTLTGRVTSGFHVGRTLGFPTANLMTDSQDKLIPGDGVYAVRVDVEGNDYPGVMNIGNRPTLDNGSQRSIEVHIIGFHDDIYEATIQVSFLGFLRQQCKFPSVAALRRQIAADRDEVVRRFPIHP